MPFRIIQPAPVAAQQGDVQPLISDGHGGFSDPNNVAPPQQYSPDNPYAPATSQQSTNPFGAAGDFVNNIGKAATGLVGGIVNPLLNLGGLAGGTVMAGIRGAQGNPQWDAPINIPNIGAGASANVNPFKQDAQGNFDPGMSLKQDTGMALSGVSDIGMMMNPELGLGGAALGGAGMGAGGAMQQKNSNLGDVALGGVEGAGAGAAGYLGGAVAGGILGKMAGIPDEVNLGAEKGSSTPDNPQPEAPLNSKDNPIQVTPTDEQAAQMQQQQQAKAQQNVQKSLLKMGINDKQAEAVSQFSPDMMKTFTDLVQAGEDKFHAQGDMKVPTVLQAASKPIEDFYGAVSDIEKELGQKQGQIVDNLDGVEANNAPIQQQMVKTFKTLGVKLQDEDGNLYKPGEAIPAGTKTTLDFTKSAIGNTDSQAKSLLGNLWEDVQSSPKMDAGDMHNYKIQIDNATGELEKNGLDYSSKGSTALKGLKTSINGELGRISPEYAENNVQLGKLYGSPTQPGLSVLERALTKTAAGVKYVDGSPLIDQLGKLNTRDAQNAITAMQNIEANFGDKYGIKAPDDIPGRALAADTAEKLTNSNIQNRGLLNTIKEGIPHGSIRRTVNIIGDVAGQVDPDLLKKTDIQTSKLNKILQAYHDAVNPEPVIPTEEAPEPVTPKKPLVSPQHIQAVKNAMAALKNAGSTTGVNIVPGITPGQRMDQAALSELAPAGAIGASGLASQGQN